ncbi:hypothetical protein [Pseudobacter ginsenosidimutans]|nr:hypothetical protein [Pseudobacter ginsenosidimutans]
MAIAKKDNSLAATSFIWLAEIEFKKQDFQAAATATLKAKEHVQ